ncbi:MAG: cephalosporin hydroxylase family protein [Pseudomonadota bacterium]
MMAGDEYADPIAAFEAERRARVAGYETSPLAAAAHAFLTESAAQKYSYNFEWLGRPIIQYPQDMVAMQALIWEIRPDLIIETGVAHGGSLIFSASMLALLELAEAREAGRPLDLRAPRRRVLGIDIEIRAHNRAAIEAHPFADRIDLIEGSSTAPETIAAAAAAAGRAERVLVCLDSNHTHAHVLAELEAYAPLTSPGSACVVFDTLIEDMPAGAYPDRPWDVGDNPKTAVFAYLERLTTEGRPASDGAPLRLEIDRAVDNTLLISVAPHGYLRRV